MNLRFLTTCSCAAIAFASLPGVATAQTPATTPPPAGTDSGSNNDNANVQERTAAADDVSQDGDIIITAQKRAENVQDVPKSVQVVSSAQLQSSNVTTLDDLRKLVPSISGTGLSIRGVASNASTISAQSKVGVTLDDVPQPSRATLANNLLDIERVEVLPGPQGTLSGRNATGGLINTVTRAPTDYFSGRVTATATDDHEYQLGAFISGPVTSNLNFSLSGYEKYFRGTRKNIITDKWQNTDVHGIRGKLQWKPDERLTVTGTLFYQKSYFRGGGIQNFVIRTLDVPQSQVYSNFDTYFAPGPIRISNPRQSLADFFPGGVPVGLNNNKIASVRDGESRTKDYGGILRVDYEVGDATLSSISSYLYERNPNTQTITNHPLENMNIRPEYDGFAHVLNKTEYLTQELRLTSPTTTALQYVVGLFYSDNTNTYDYERYLFPVNWDRDFSQRSMAAFGHLSYEFPTQTTIQGGIRYERDKIDYTWIFQAIPTVVKVTENGTVLPPFVGNPLVISSGRESANFINYDVGIQQKLGEDIMFYGTYSKAAQGPVYDAEDNTVAVLRPLESLPQEKVKNFELGFKSQFLDRRLTLNVAFFNGKYDNYQVQTITVDTLNPNATPVLKLNAVGEVRTRGVEFTANAQITDQFRLGVVGAYTNAKILDFPNAPCYGNQTAAQGCNPADPANGHPTPYQTNLAGNPLASTPKWNFVVTPNYRLPIDALWEGATLTANANIRHVSKINTDLLGNPANDISSKTYVNASLGLEVADYKLELFVNNLTKTRADTFGTGLFAYSVAPSQATTRTFSREDYRYFGLRFNANF